MATPILTASIVLLAAAGCGGSDTARAGAPDLAPTLDPPASFEVWLSRADGATGGGRPEHAWAMIETATRDARWRSYPGRFARCVQRAATSSGHVDRGERAIRPCIRAADELLASKAERSGFDDDLAARLALAWLMHNAKREALARQLDAELRSRAERCTAKSGKEYALVVDGWVHVLDRGQRVTDTSE